MPRYPRFTDAADGLSASVYTSLLGLARANAPEVFALNVGDTFLEPPEPASVDALAHARFEGMHRYSEVRGEPRLLDAVVDDAARRDRTIDRDSIQVTPGGTTGLDLACRALLAHGDEVLLLAPYWPLIRGIVSANGARIIEVPFFTELAKPSFDLRAALEAHVTDRTVAIYVNSPNNPTGVVLDHAQITELARFAHKHELWVLSDEAYERLDYGTPAQPIWMHEQLRERTVVLHTLSKSYGLSGARVAYLHGPHALMSAIFDLSTFTNYCAARPMQIAGAAALSSPEGERWVQRARELYRDAAERTAKVLRVPAPESGTFAFFDLEPHLAPGEKAHDLLERIARAGVVLTPGTAAGQAYGTWARLCFTCVPTAVLTRALATLERVLYASSHEAP